MEKHYQTEHKDETCPQIGVISKEEKSILEKKSTNAKPKMRRKDFDALTDEELKLFSVKDFWSTKKQQWQAGEGGLFGKQNSERLKNIFGADLFKKKN